MNDKMAQLINLDNINSALFLKYIESYGFDPSYYYYILELFQSGKGSMSQFLKQYYPYLLSRRVNYDEIDAIGIDGAYGYLHSDGILVPKTLENDEHFLKRSDKSLYTRHSYGTPTIDDFDVIIANGTSPYMDNTANFDIDKYLGFCMDSTDENLDISLRRYEHLVDLINRQSSREYIFEHDTLSSMGKELCLVRKKPIHFHGSN